MADISQIKITNGITYNLLDAEAAREAALDGLKFFLDSPNKLLIAKGSASITAASDTALAEISLAVGELADLWETAVTGVTE